LLASAQREAADRWALYQQLARVTTHEAPAPAG
jgi:hypothetical protein